MAGIKSKTALKILGALTFAAGVLPLAKPYVPQLSAVPTEGMAIPIVVAVLGLVGIYLGFSKNSTY